MPIAGNISEITLPNGNTYTIGNPNSSDITIIAADYNTSNSYNAGDYCTHEGKLYRATTSTNGSWNSSRWTETTVMAEIIARCSILPANGVSF